MPESVRAGLAAVPRGAEIVVVHDAARPLASAELFQAVIGAVRDGADGAVPGLAVADTLKRVDDVRVTATVDRVGLVAVQTPQAFESGILRAAHATGADATDDAALVEAIGGTVVVVPGDPRNLKVTGPADLMIAAALLETSAASRVRRASDHEARDPRRPRVRHPPVRRRRVARVLVLGGVRIDGRGLAGHSDADAVCHAVADALLGPVGPPRPRQPVPGDRRHLPRRVVGRAACATWCARVA